MSSTKNRKQYLFTIQCKNTEGGRADSQKANNT